MKHPIQVKFESRIAALDEYLVEDVFLGLFDRRGFKKCCAMFSLAVTEHREEVEDRAARSKVK